MVLKSKITKKINPKDEELLKKIKIEKDINILLGTKKVIFIYFIKLNNQIIGFAEIMKGKKYLTTIKIDELYRRKGLASFVYDYIEKDLKIKLLPSDYQLPSGQLFWENRSKKNPSLKPKSKNARILKTLKTKIKVK